MSHNKIEGNELLDFYGSLLTKHQLNILEDFFVEDLSMGEIADNYGISKAAVSDVIKRSYEQLKEYENKLSLIKKANDIDRIIEKMTNEKIDINLINELKKINRG
ncbi:MAG: DNA-binding protein [Erysipelotrichaceae bacterium]|nr:DNA-binding protein [Erysipelotrichaceae bacterium]